MRAVVQRVHAARVEVAKEVTGEIAAGLVVFLGIGKEDTAEDVSVLVDKVLKLRIFEDDAGKMSRSVLDVGGALLVVSQFTLHADTSRGRRPSFDRAMRPEGAELLYEEFVTLARQQVPVATGRFRAEMRVLVDNDGPVTILLDTHDRPVDRA